MKDIIIDGIYYLRSQGIIASYYYIRVNYIMKNRVFYMDR